MLFRFVTIFMCICCHLLGMHPARHRRRWWTARPGGGHGILGLPHNLHILGPENKSPFFNETLVTIAYLNFKETPFNRDYKSFNFYYCYWTNCLRNGSHKLTACFLIYYTYKVRIYLFNIKPGYCRVVLWVVTMFSRLVTTRKMLRWQCILTPIGVHKRKPQIDGWFLNELHI